MMPNIEYELSSIVQYTYKLAGYQNCKAIFNGVTSMTDFTKFVYFEYCATRYINREEQHSVNYFLSKQHKQYIEAYEKERRNWDEHIEDASKFSYSWLYSKEYRSFARSVSRYIDSMIKNRHIAKTDQFSSQQAGMALQDLIDYDGSTRAKQLEGTPIGRTYFYQALCECAFKIKGVKKYEWLSLKRTSTNSIAEFYADVDRFIKNFMLSNYSRNFTDEERSDYISKAINLVKFADRRKLDLIYDFAKYTEEYQPNYFSDRRNREIDEATPSSSRFRFGDLPPIFFDTVTIIPWEIDLFDLESIKMFSEIYKWFTLSNGTISLASPYMCFDRYIRCFLLEDEEQCKIEETRYYLIKLLAESLENKLLLGEVEIDYSEKNFASFIHNYYNVFDIYREKQKLRENVKLTPKQANFVHEIASRLYPKKHQCRKLQETPAKSCKAETPKGL